MHRKFGGGEFDEVFTSIDDSEMKSGRIISRDARFKINSRMSEEMGILVEEEVR